MKTLEPVPAPPRGDSILSIETERRRFFVGFLPHTIVCHHDFCNSDTFLEARHSPSESVKLFGHSHPLCSSNTFCIMRGQLDRYFLFGESLSAFFRVANA